MFINLTPHDINIKRGDEIIVIPKTGFVARVFTKDTKSHSVEGFKVFKQRVTKIIDLPDEQEGVNYIVSHVVLKSIKEMKMFRRDVFAPNTTTGASKSGKEIEYVDSLIRL